MVLGNRKYAIGIHVIVWLLFIFINYQFVKSSGLSYNMARQALLIAIYMVVFYVFYLLIVPLLFRRKLLLFALTSVVFIIGFVFVNQTIHERLNVKRFEEVQKLVPRGKIFPKYFMPDKAHGFSESHHKRRRRFQLIGNTLEILFFVLTALVLRLVQKWQYDEKARYVLEKEKSDAELLFLKQQVNPHFLFNSLNSIYSLANKKSELTTTAILKLSSILRYVLYQSEKSYVPLSEELATLENYIELQRLRVTKEVSLQYKVKGNPNTFVIEPLLLLPIFENAFKHGVDSTMPSFIDISITISYAKLMLTIRNTIVPKEDNTDGESGIGLKNIKRRLELLYPGNYSLEINDREGIFTVKLDLKLKK